MTPATRRILPAGPRPQARFVAGQHVLYAPSNMNPRVTAGAHFTVVRVLPGDLGRPSYRIKSMTESYERIAEEDQLSLPTLE
jgi:hypothetical protein